MCRRTGTPRNEEMNDEHDHRPETKADVAIIGAGFVGTAVLELFKGQALVYDLKPGYSNSKTEINSCKVALVCVPTPSTSDGSCDTSAVESVVRWLEVELIIICSTVVPGTTDRLISETGKHIVFQPEFIGETPYHPFRQAKDCGFVVLGGAPGDTAEAARLYRQVYGPETRFHFCDARTAEMAKYMDNSFFAAKVTFCNEFYEVAKAHAVDYEELRKVWLADPRINPDHTEVFPSNRGFSGKCLPKDLQAIVQSCQGRGYCPTFLRAILQANNAFCSGLPAHPCRSA